jgi:hypothetical protein
MAPASPRGDFNWFSRNQFAEPDVPHAGRSACAGRGLSGTAMRSRQPFLFRPIRLGGLGEVTIAETIVVGVIVALVVALLWRFIL